MNANVKLFDKFESLPKNRKGFWLLTLTKKTQQKVLAPLKEKKIAEVLSFLDPTQTTEIIDHIPHIEKREKIIVELNKELRQKVQFLFGFAPDTVGRIMDVNYIEVGVDDSFESVKKRVLKHEKKAGKMPVILALENGSFKGELSYHAFITHSVAPTKSIKNALHPLSVIHHAQGTKKVIETFHRHPHQRIVILGDDENILGTIYSDDIIRLLHKQATQTLYDFAGVHNEEDAFDSVAEKVKRRYKWLILNLATAYLAAWVVSLFADTLSKVVILAAYMPIVAGMGGNAGTQTLAVMVRSLALGEIELATSLRAIINEVGAGLANGIINGLLVTLMAVLWNQSALLGLVTAGALVVNLVVAGFFGAFIPLFMKWLGKDPATSATIFITTATDVFGFLAFLGLASIFLV